MPKNDYTCKSFPNGVDFDSLNEKETEAVIKQMGKDLAEDYIASLPPLQQMVFGVMPESKYDKMVGPITAMESILEEMDLREIPIEEFYERERLENEKKEEEERERILKLIKDSYQSDI